MITKIKALDFKIFKNYPNGVPPQPKEFKKCNIIYGLNGSGKTTLSELFKSIQDLDEENYSLLNYEIGLDNGKTIKTGEKCPHEIKIFNKTYIEENIVFKEGKATPILLLGKDNIEDDKKLTEAKQKISKIKKKQIKWNKKISQHEKAIEKEFISIAKIIKTEGNIPNYNKGKAELSMENMVGRHELSNDILEERKKFIRSESKEFINSLPVQDILDDIIKESKMLCEKEIQVIIAEDLKAEKADTISWVENGLNIHDLRHDKDIEPMGCKFCLNDLSENRIKELLGHFNTASENLKSSLDVLIGKINNWIIEINNMILPAKAQLYINFQTEYVKQVKILNNNKKSFLAELDKLIKELEAKKRNMLNKVDVNAQISAKGFFSNIEECNNIINQHNEFLNDIDGKKKSAEISVEGHYLSTIIDEVNKNERVLSIYRRGIEKIDNLENVVEVDIEHYQSKAYKSGLACEEINKYIDWFFGRREISFSIKKDEEGKEKYIINRGEYIAENLSEGEKTAIALIYFVIEISDSDENSIVVIDDPVSSLDSNFLFNAFTCLERTMKKRIAQIFIFTHSFELLKMLLNTFEDNNNSDGEPRDIDACYFMLKNKFIDGERHAFIDELDKMLSNFSSEYQYLFKVLHDFQALESPCLDDSYPVPNMIRKFVEMFVEFQSPKKKVDLQAGFRQITRDNKHDIGNAEVTEVMKFLNVKSHGGNIAIDPNLTIIIQKVIKTIFKIIQIENPNHFKRMQKIMNKVEGN